MQARRELTDLFYLETTMKTTFFLALMILSFLNDASCWRRRRRRSPPPAVATEQQARRDLNSVKKFGDEVGLKINENNPYRYPQLGHKVSFYTAEQEQNVNSEEKIAQAQNIVLIVV